MATRRDALKLSALAGATSLLPIRLLHALQRGELIKRAIPGTGEKLPIVGLGSSASFRRAADSGDVGVVRDVIGALLDNGGTVFDTAPSYGASEQVAGQVAQDLGATDKVFWATKLNVVPRGGTSANPDEARAQAERSFAYIGKDPIDLIQVHNLQDVPTQLGILRDLKARGRLRDIGVTYTGESRYPDLVEVMRKEPIDFIGVDYAVDNRNAATEVFPVAEERGIGVLVYLPFGRSRLWNRVAGRELPPWAAAIGI
ncbi:MAG: aldo/keto reductase, partial [Woeseiaceae bacterium]